MQPSTHATMDIVDEPTNPGNKVMRAGIRVTNSAAWFKCDYMWQPNRKYKATVKYKATIDNGRFILSLRVADNRESWSSPGTSPWDNTITYLLYNNDVDISLGWQTVTTEFSSDEPEINNIYKYLYVMVRSPDIKSDFYIDSIEIEDLGPYSGAIDEESILNYFLDAIYDSFDTVEDAVLV